MQCNRVELLPCADQNRVEAGLHSESEECLPSCPALHVIGGNICPVFCNRVIVFHPECARGRALYERALDKTLNNECFIFFFARHNKSWKF